MSADLQPVVDGRGATILGPRDIAIERQNPDVLVAPKTDAGTVPNLKWPFALSHNRVLSGGWARETTTRELAISTEIAGVNMRLTPGGIRELHWHPNADEWQYYLKGQGRMTVFASGGKARTFDYQAGDVGAVPFAMGHYIENTGEDPSCSSKCSAPTISPTSHWPNGWASCRPSWSRPTSTSTTPSSPRCPAPSRSRCDRRHDPMTNESRH
jgi:mannose-6-phosphate isomerase-like protein (cupin superfamily)